MSITGRTHCKENSEHVYIVKRLPHFFIVSVCKELLSQPDDNNTAAVVLMLPLHDLPNFDLNFSLSDCTDSTDSCDDMFMRV